jgi:hypothetical protein
MLVALTSGCTGEADPRGSAETPTPSSTPTDDGGSVADSEACEEVRTGIDAFNEGDFEETVEHFRSAVPLAEDRDDGSQAAGDLVDAVHYYADLAPADYSEAARSSSEFLKYKNITLGQCMPAGYEPSESPGTDV